MKASEYIERKRARKGKPYWRWAHGERRGVYAGEHGFIVCGTTADIDTEDKRHAIAADVMARVERL